MSSSPAFLILVFFVMGFAVALEARRASGFALAASLKYLVAFALLHSLVEWTDMFLLILANLTQAGRGFIKGVVHARPFDKRSLQRVAFGDRAGPSTLLRTGFSTSSKNGISEQSPGAPLLTAGLARSTLQPLRGAFHTLRRTRSRTSCRALKERW